MIITVDYQTIFVSRLVYAYFTFINYNLATFDIESVNTLILLGSFRKQKTLENKINFKLLFV
jgi:hypothetical protein